MAWLSMPTFNLPCYGGKDSYWGSGFRERDYCFLGSLMATHCEKTCPQNGWGRKCFRGKDWCALKLKEGCSSSDITVKRHKVHQHTCFLTSRTAPWLHQAQVLTGRGHTHPLSPVPVLHICRAASSVKTFIPAHCKMLSSALNNH